MIFLPKSAWRYGLLIVILFAIAAVTSTFIIAYLEEQIAGPEYEHVIRQLSASIWTLTMGFLFLAGALGLWAIRSTAEIEGRRRIGRFVDTMDYLSDGLLVLDKNGRIMGSNPAVKHLVPEAMKERQPVDLRDAFPCIRTQHAERLLGSGQPCEIQEDCVYSQGLRTLRFRSQPSEGVILVLVSDVTEARSQEIRQKQTAQLQLVGRIAGGVADDFNDILCAISGHSGLLKRSDLDPELIRKSLDVIAKETQRGALLSRQLLDLSRSGGGGNPSENLGENVEEAAGLLRIALSPEWTVKTTVQGKYPAVLLTPAQIEQVVLNLGLLTADVQTRAGTIMITLDPPGQDHLLAVGNQFAAVILISADVSTREGVLQVQDSLKQAIPVRDETGVILSVVRSMVEEAGGQVDHLTAPGGLFLYRVCLPHLDTAVTRAEDNLLPASELNVYVSRWRVLLGGSSNEMGALAEGLSGLGSAVEKRHDLGSVLACIQAVKALDAMVLDKRVLGREADSLLQAIVRLAPQVGVVVLCQDPEQEASHPRSVVMFEKYTASLQKIIQAMVDAKTLAHAGGAKNANLKG